MVKGTGLEPCALGIALDKFNGVVAICSVCLAVIDQAGGIIKDRAIFITPLAKREAMPPVAAAKVKDPMPGTDRDKLTYHVNLPTRKLIVANRASVRQEVTFIEKGLPPLGINPHGHDDST
jgi:hypothetical protein